MDYVEFHREPPANLPTMVVAFGGWIDAGEAVTGAIAPDCRWGARHSMAAERVLDLAAAREPRGSAPVSWDGAPSDVARLLHTAP